MHEQGHQHLPEPRWVVRHPSLRGADHEQLHVGLPTVRHPRLLRLVCIGTPGEPQQLQAPHLQRLPREWRQAPAPWRDAALHLRQLLHVPNPLQVRQLLQMIIASVGSGDPWIPGIWPCHGHMVEYGQVIKPNFGIRSSRLVVHNQ